ncbi:RHS repeat-associated core domain-containing protein [Flavobacterium sp. GB2R13]|uniref:RHS repeat-associated core domain-containing protein n=1 Tax=Flavobacterium algoris TaxID=3398733 RepID=UPI003A8A4EFE
MKQYYLLLAIFATHLIAAQNFTDTKGELQISSSGTATYNLPIAMPPSIKNVAPVINLTYSSGVRGGIAGQGWNINSISTISRMATRRDIDGFVDGVDFDSDDKLALDGQRLLLKTGTYLADGSTYETEYKSNTKIELKIENGGASTFFIVTSPDGSRTWYGSKGSGTYQNATSTNAWFIVRFEDTNGNNIEYNYTNIVYNSTNQLYINYITFSANQVVGIASQNKIVFNYRDAKRIERDYIKGAPVYATKILDNIQVLANNVLFRKYQLSQIEDTSLGYERISQVQEFNAQNEASNPVLFEYNSTSTTTTRTEKTYTNNLNFNNTDLAGDFDGDGRLDFVANDQLFTNLFNGSSGNTPINLPFSSANKKMFTATTILNNKLNQNSSIVLVNDTANNTEFKIYNKDTAGVTYNYSRNFSMNNSFTTEYTSSSQYTPECYSCDYSSYQDTRDCDNIAILNNIKKNLYIEGDFNGDGVSEVLIRSEDGNPHYILETTNYEDGMGFWAYATCNAQVVSNGGGMKYYLADLNPSSSSILGGKGFVDLGLNTIFFNDIDFGQQKEYVADFNGDGKSDILIVRFDTKAYKILSFKQLNVSPWVQLELIGSGILDKYSSTKQILFGDYNGDGKTDLMLPDTEGGINNTLWHTYYSNPKPTGGDLFVKESQNIVEYWPNTGTYYSTQTHFSSYYAMDINGDGKSDLVRVWRKYYKPAWTINDHNTQWQVTAFTNNIGKIIGSAFTQTYDSGIFDSGSPDIPIPISSNYKYQGANTELVIVRGHYNKIEYYQFNKDVDTDNRLKSVTESSGNIKQTIDYSAMVSGDAGLGNYSTDFYSSSNTATYPDIEIIRNTASYLVSKLTATINGVSKFQDFKYRSYISNFNYGTVGFSRTARSSWYLSPSDAKIWTTQYNDTSLRGANTITWSNTNPATVFATIPDNLLSTKTNIFATYTNPTTKVYNVLLSSQTTIDAITGIKSENTFTYDGTVTSANYYGLQTLSVAKQYSGTTVQGTTTTTSVYDNNPTGVGTAYYIGRPKSTNTSTLIYTGDTRTSGEIYTYTGTNLTKTEKTGNNTYAIVEDMTYDTTGNLLTKTVSAPAAPTLIAARTITDEYDTTKRFVIKKTDHQGFVTSFIYNTLGQVTKSTNYLGVVSDFVFDNWGKLTQTTTTNVSTTPLVTTITYAKLADGGYTTTSQNTVGDNAKSITQYDVLGRTVINTTKGFAVNSLISKQVVYDALGRKLKESEPYFSAPSKWISYEYDYLQRPTKVTASTGRIQTLSYSGLTTTSVDDGKTTTATVDALGNKTQTSDPGGTINFTYYANGQLKESNYEGHKVAITIDGWGNKTATSDPNAGTYTYAYDAFGQIINETTPKGSTNNTYDNYGKLIKKKILGDGADYETDYLYNSFAQLTSESSKKAIGTTIDSFTYGFDTLHRLNTTSESNASFSQTKSITYDTYGRVATATNATQELTTGLSTSVITKNNYNTYNGIMDKMTDANDTVLWQLNTANEKMQSLTETLGNGIAITNVYDTDNYFTSQKHAKNSINVLYNTYSFNAVKGTLSNRQNVALGTNEVFTYDTLDRLTQWTNPLTAALDTNTYDTKGRITNNNKLGTVNYNTNLATGIYQKTSIALTTEGTNYYTNLPKQTVSYTMFKSPISINESNKGSTAFVYNSHLSRQTMTYGYQMPGAVYTKSKSYTDDGSVEILKTPATITIRTYMGGDAYTAPLYVDKIKTIATGAIVDKKYYLHRDYLGSIIAISDDMGVAVERRQFDAWGNLAKLEQNGVAITLPTNGSSAGLMMLDRGYTSHEHLAEVGLIQMNGRLYDPALRSFLMPDNFIQQPENTQNYNRYAYVLNNPLMYTDPSGEFGVLLAIGIGALVAATTYTMTALLADVPFSVGGLAKATFIGAASAAVTFGIGTAAGNLFSSTQLWAKAAFQALAHGTFQGTMSGIQGGKFFSSFVAGALSSIAASAFSWDGNSAAKGLGWASSIRESGAGMIAFGTVSGGTGAAITGGNFWQGAVTGLVVSGLNHYAHNIKTNRYIDKRLLSLGKNPDSAAQIEQSELGGFAKDMYPNMMEQADDAPFLLKDKIISPNGEAAYGQTVATTNNGVTHASHIEISRSSLSSWHTLASTIGHELNHYIFYNTEVYDRWVRNFGVDRADALNEYKAHYWEKQWGGSPSMDVMNRNLRIFNTVK